MAARAGGSLPGLGYKEKARILGNHTTAEHGGGRGGGGGGARSKDQEI